MKNKYWEKRYRAELITVTKEKYISVYSSMHPNLNLDVYVSLYYYLKEAESDAPTIKLDSAMIQLDRLRLPNLNDIIIISCPKIIFNWFFINENEVNFWKLVHSAEDKLGNRDHNSLYKIILK